MNNNDKAGFYFYKRARIFLMEELMGNCSQINHVWVKFTISPFLEEGRIMYAYSLSLLISKIRME